MEIQHIPTPALLVDLDAMESNSRLMADFFAGKAAKLRPHFKNHKAPMLALRQLREGAIGMTIREAEILVEHGLLGMETNSSRTLEVGRKVELWVHYSDATVNLHSSLYGVRNDHVEEVFPIVH